MTHHLPADHWLNRPRVVAGVLTLGVLVLLGRLWFQLLAPPLPDEAYYWLWGQHWDWSYFDHAPLQAWMQGAFTAAGLSGIFGLRVLPAAITTVLILWALSRVLHGQGIRGRQAMAVLMVVIASPVIFIQTTIVFNDHLMLGFLALGLLAAVRVLEETDAGQRPAAWRIYAVGLCLGLAILSKYNAALPSLALIVLILTHPAYRVLLRNPHLYGAALLGVVCLFPIFWWNLTQGGESFQYNLQDRLNFNTRAAVKNALTFVALGVPAFSLALIPGLFQVLRGGGGAAHRVAIWVFLLSSAVWFIISGFSFVLYYWNIVGYLFILPFAAIALRRAWLVIAHMMVAIALSFGMAVNYAHSPVTLAIGQPVDHETSLTYGWDVLTPRIAALMAEHGAARQVASDYRYGAILAWFSRDRDVEVFSSRRSQFDIWQERSPLQQGPAIILTGTDFPMSDAIKAHFSHLTHLERHTITRAGREVMIWDLWLGH